MYDEYVAKLKTGATTNIDEAKLAAIEIKSARVRPPSGMLMGGEGDGDEGGEAMGAGAAAMPGGLMAPTPAMPVPAAPAAGK
jgi:hypothetical protein